METTNGINTHYVPGLAQYGVAGWQYFGQDRLGSVRTLMNPTGELLLARNYDPFGNVLAQGGVGSSGLVYLRARYYSPEIGRFLTADSIVPNPVGSQGWNGYAYVANNPIRFVDPSGHCWGPMSFLRDVPGYDTTCDNLDLAILIAGHPNATPYEKAQAVAYVEAIAVSHIVLAEALVIGGYNFVAPVAAAGPTCANQIQRLSSVWNSPWWQRGRDIEDLLGRNLSRNFPVIDRFIYKWNSLKY